MSEYTQFAVIVPDSLRDFDLETYIQHAVDNIPEDEIVDVMNFITDNNDIFMSSYIGYWARGVKHYEGEGWLMYDEGAEDRPLSPQEEEEVIEQWETNKALVKDAYFINKKTAFQIALNIRHIGDWDADDIDCAVQEVLFGELVYG